jgi:phosphopantetheinyl transferase
MAEMVSVLIARDDSLDRRAGGRAGTPRRARLSERLLRLALEDASGASARLWRTGRSASGRPIVSGGPPSVPRPDIGLAHSGAWLAAVASPGGAVAVDIEVVRERNFADLARQLRWPAALRAAPLTANRFYQLWTLWEATLKLPGGYRQRQRGLFAALARVFEPGAPGAAAAAACFAQSWLCPDHFWLTVVSCGARAPRIRLLAVAAWGMDGEAARLAEHEADAGRIEPPAVARHPPLC